MRATRRTVLKGMAAAAAATAAGGVVTFPSRLAAAAPPARRPQGTTLDSTVLRGDPVNAAGYKRLVAGPPEPHLLREDLGAVAQPGRQGRRTAVLTFAHLTDIHVIDAQSPARVEFLDRYDDQPETATIFSSAYRPQEFLCTQLADSILHRVRQVGVGPVTGVPLGFAICTGDNTDNQQFNELRWQIDLMDGTPFTPNSGSAAYEGVADNTPAPFYDESYWHPEAPPTGSREDAYKTGLGFPTVPGLLEAAIAQFVPSGIGMAWYSCYGNHDGLVQGNFPTTFQFQRIAVGGSKVVSAGPSPADLAALRDGDGRVLRRLMTAPGRQVTPDEDRRIIPRGAYVQEHFTTGGTPLGHGFTNQNLLDGTAYYVFDPSPVLRGIVLDTVNPNGESSGSLDSGQFAWLRAQLELVSGPGRDRLVLVFSHHTIGSMTNRFPVGSDDPADYGQRVLGPEVEALLLQFPNVIAWVNGHTHVNSVTPHRREDGTGFWEINSAAHIDFPCQARLVELTDNRDGTLSIFTTMLDADAALVPPADPTTGAAAMASLARELGANDGQERIDRRGSAEDRNVELLVAAPFPLTTTPPGQRRGDERLGGLGRAEPAPSVAGARELAATGPGPAGAVAAAGLVAAGALAARGRREDAADR